ncbi:hypothetical protein D5086_023215 [Populus alba]|uniref:Uncharacterized protein n=1 Tax=Populus alba TaxID=43335 RepID=A0ACC4B954_POPAL
MRGNIQNKRGKVWVDDGGTFLFWVNGFDVWVCCSQNGPLRVGLGVSVSIGVIVGSSRQKRGSGVDFMGK